MDTGQWMTLGALAFCCVLPAHGTVARQRGWTTGEIFDRGETPTIVAAVCVIALLLHVGYVIYSGAGSWWFLLWAALGYFAGGPIIWAVLGRHSGLCALVAAPILTLAAPLI